MSIHHGDCLDVMATMEPESVDAIVTDPPYGIRFMDKGWDTFGGPLGIDHTKTTLRSGSMHAGRYNKGPRASAEFQLWCERWAAEALRLTRPGGWLLSFGGTRTAHRLAAGIEDAGWIIRDMLVWGYASGFPKSKASLKPAWEPIVMARKPGPPRELAIDACRIPTDIDLGRTNHTTSMFNARNTTPHVDNSGGLGRWPANIVLTDPIFDGGIEGVVGGGDVDATRSVRVRAGSVIDNGNTHGDFVSDRDSIGGYDDSGTYSRFFEIPRGDSCDWCGAPGVAPSSSPRSDPVATAPSHAATWLDGMPGSTANADRSPTASDTNGTDRSTLPELPPAIVSPSRQPASRVERPTTSNAIMTTTGNLWLCEPCAERATSDNTPQHERPYGRGPLPVEVDGYTRWLLIPKADRADREPVLGGLPVGFAPTMGNGIGGREHDPADVKAYRRNVHPTVKPTDLMRHLVRLVTPTGGVVLDPFLGSGTTGIAAEMEGFAWIGIEREAEYVAIAEARLNGTQRGMAL